MDPGTTDLTWCRNVEQRAWAGPWCAHSGCSKDPSPLCERNQRDVLSFSKSDEPKMHATPGSGRLWYPAG